MPLSWNEIKDRSVAFVREWGDESSEDAEAKSFWDAFFNVFGVNRRRLASFEHNVKKACGGQGFIDLFWPGMLIAEHKSRGKSLDAAFTQANDYFAGLKDAELPRYVIVSDFAKIRLRNIETGDENEFPLSELPKNLSLFGFIAGYETRTYNDQSPVNIKAAESLADLHDSLLRIGYEGHELEVYLVRILFCMFADDTGIFMPRSAFEDFLRTRTSEDGSDLALWLNQLFQTLNTPPEKRLKNLDEQVASFPYVNGKLFEEYLQPASFDRKMRDTLLACCELDWGTISPAIFGSLFQGIMDAKVRRNLGAHYTSEKNILKLIGPLFMEDLRAEFERIKSQQTKLKVFHNKLGELNFFDPACGCGNFLVISYRELRLLELQVIKILYGKELQQLSLDAIDQYVKVDVHQFHGIEIEEWPAQIARVAMWLIDHQMNLLVGGTFGHTVVRIPLVKSANIVHGNALRIDWESVIPSSRCRYILGNPPFIGYHLISKEQEADFDAVMSDIQGSGVLDFVAAWHVKTVRYIQGNGFESDGNRQIRAALVSTNSICQGEQVGVLWGWMLAQGIKIHFAHRTFRWSNEAKGVAAVHCIIVGFGQIDISNKTIYDYESVNSEPHVVAAANINPYLVDAPDLAITSRSSPICDVPEMKYGSKPTDGGFLLLSDEDKCDLLSQEPEAASWVKPILSAKEFLHNTKRWCLWLEGISPSELNALPVTKARIQAVRDFRSKSKKAKTRELANIPTLFAERRQPKNNYLLVPRHSSENRNVIPVGFFGPDNIVSDSCSCVPDATLYHFGVMSSAQHMAWVKYVCGRIKSDYRYSNTVVYNNFPWPVDATESHRDVITKAAQGVLDARALYPESTLADLYDPLSMPLVLVKAHQTLDKAVDAAYVPSGGKRSWATEAGRVAFLFEQYQRLTSLLPTETSPKGRKTK